MKWRKLVEVVPSEPTDEDPARSSLWLNADLVASIEPYTTEIHAWGVTSRVCLASFHSGSLTPGSYPGEFIVEGSVDDVALRLLGESTSELLDRVRVAVEAWVEESLTTEGALAFLRRELGEEETE